MAAFPTELHRNSQSSIYLHENERSRNATIQPPPLLLLVLLILACRTTNPKNISSQGFYRKRQTRRRLLSLRALLLRRAKPRTIFTLYSYVFTNYTTVVVWLLRRVEREEMGMHGYGKSCTELAWNGQQTVLVSVRA
jgi:hypothetical protein